MLKDLFKDSRGLTLVETVAAAGLIFLVLIAALELSWRVWDFAAKGRESFNETTELRTAVMWVSRDLRRAEDVDDAAPGRLVLTVNGTAVTYTLDGDELTREEGGSRRVVARGIAKADFGAGSREGGVLVTAELTGKKGNEVRTCVWVYTGS
jgi:hypothetical protein